MTVTLDRPAGTTPAPAPRAGRRGRALLLGATLLLVAVSVTRVVSGVDDLTSVGTAGAALSLAVPIGLAALGGLFAERAGVVNIGLEGMMILGTWTGAWVGYQAGPWAGVLAGIAGGAIGGLVHALATVSFGVDHVISGVAINIIAAGVVRYLSVVTYAHRADAGPTQSPSVDPIGTNGLPVLSGGHYAGWHSPDLLADLAGKHWFLVSDTAGILRGATGDVSYLTMVAVLLVPVSAFVLFRTAFGLRLRSVGENPVAAESLGVGVYRMKYAGVVLSGALAGMAGAFLVTVAASYYREGQTGGRGFIALAALIFGNWRAGGAATGSLLFGYTDGLQTRSNDDVHPLLLLVGLLLVVLAVVALRRRQRAQAAVAAVVGAGLVVLFALTGTVPQELVGATPYLTTLLVLALASQRLRPPAADGLPYRRGQAR